MRGLNHTVISREDDDHLVPHIFRFDRRREVSDGRVRKVNHRVVCLQENRSHFNLSYVCPEPVLVNVRGFGIMK